MSRGAASGRSAAVPLVGAAAAALLWLFHALAGFDPAFGHGPLRQLVEAAAVLATAFTVVSVAGLLLLAMLFPNEAGRTATGLQRVLVYAVLGFGVFAAALDHLGFDLRVVLATSAIAGLATGLALQPTLVSTIAGMNLLLDRALKVGDAVVIDGQQIRVLSLNWRSMVGQGADGRRVIVPNTRLSDSALTILPRDQPLRLETPFTAPAAKSPRWVHALAVSLLGDLPQVDPAHPIEVRPAESAGCNSEARYRASYWVRRYQDADGTEGEFLARLWYAAQRHRLHGVQDKEAPAGSGSAASARETLERTIRDGLAAAGWTDAHAEASAPGLAEKGIPLLFAPDERLIVPDDLDGWTLVILEGQAVPASALLPGLAPARGLSEPLARASRAAALHSIAEELAVHIGPYAEFAVRRAADRAHGDLIWVCEVAAAEIPDEEDRRRFLARLVPDRPEMFGPGSIVSPADCSAAAACLRAFTEVHALALEQAPASAASWATP